MKFKALQRAVVPDTPECQALAYDPNDPSLSRDAPKEGEEGSETY